jgi:hypothetical protein
MAISFVASTTFATTTANDTSYTFTAPAGVQTDDLIICAVTRNQDVAGTPTFSMGTGFTNICQIGDSSFNGLLTIGWKIRQSGDTSYTWTTSGTGSNSDGTVGICLAYRGVDTTSPFVVENQNVEQDGNNTHVTPTVNNTESSSWRVAIFGETLAIDTTKSWSCASNTERADVNLGQSGLNPTISAHDSNAVISTGNTSATGTLTSDDSAFATYGWIGILRLGSASATNANAGTGAISTASNAPRGAVGAKAQVIG